MSKLYSVGGIENENRTNSLLSLNVNTRLAEWMTFP